MIRVRRALTVFIVGCLAGITALAASVAARPELAFDLDRPLPPFIQGFHGLERDGALTFAWTTARVTAQFDGLDRRVAWLCTIRFSAPRAASVPPPSVEVLVDGARVAGATAADRFMDVAFEVPTVSRAGLSLALDVAPTFRPGGADARELGILVDRFGCRPRGRVWPSTAAMLRVAVGSGTLASVFALLGLGWPGALAIALIAAAAPSALMTIDGAVYGPYAATVMWLAVGIGAAAALVILGVTRARRQALSGPAIIAVGAAAIGLFVQLAGLLHPSKPDIDALFHAHRLDMVLSGQFYFTQVMPNGVTFPYAIGLYVVAAPFAWIFANHVAVVRIVAAVAGAIGGALLYPMIARVWKDRRTAVLAVVLFQIVPVSYAVLGNANLTNAFGQSAALIALAAVVWLPLGAGRWGARIGLAALMALALCSHVSTVTLLPGVLFFLVAFLWWRGDADARQTMRSILLAGVLALGFSVVAYWGHFGPVYRTALERVWAGPVTATPSSGGDETPFEPGGGAWGRVQGPSGFGARAANAAAQATDNVGWPMLILAAAGAWHVARRRVRDRLSCLLLAWATLWIGATLWTIATRVDYAYLRYAAEFLGRINLATYPVIVVLAAQGVAWAWRDHLAPSVRHSMRIASAVLVFATAHLAFDAWWGWFYR